MKRTITALVVAGVASLGVAVPADAAPIRECGNDTHGYWSYRSPMGAGNYNLTTRNMTCARARRLVSSGMWQNYSCRQTRLGIEYYDVRCVRGNKVFHWQAGA